MRTIWPTEAQARAVCRPGYNIHRLGVAALADPKDKDTDA